MKTKNILKTGFLNVFARVKYFFAKYKPVKFTKLPIGCAPERIFFTTEEYSRTSRFLAQRHI